VVSGEWKTGDIIEMGIIATHFGTTSITLTCEVRNKISREKILTIDKMVFVNLDKTGNPKQHFKTQITYSADRFKD
jgi:acyl-CoA hydrolase